MTIRISSVADSPIGSEAVRSFYRENWDRRIALPVEAFYSWQFRDYPGSCGHDRCCIAYEEATNVVLGVMGLTPRPFYLEGARQSGAELTTWIVREDARHYGIGGKILNYLKDTYAVLIGMGISPEALPIYRRSGFRYLRAIPRYLKVYDWESLAGYARYTPNDVKIDKSWSKAAPAPRWRLLEFDDGAIDAVQAAAIRRMNLFARDAVHVRWRYVTHPRFDYKVFVVAGDGNPDAGALVCLREETSVPGVRILHVIDCLGEEHALPAAVSFIESYGREHRFHAVDFFCTASIMSKHFLARGWFSIMDDVSLCLPHLFHPVELRDPPTTSLIYWSRDDMTALCDVHKLYVTKQDADFDRPTLEHYEGQDAA